MWYAIASELFGGLNAAAIAVNTRIAAVDKTQSKTTGSGRGQRNRRRRRASRNIAPKNTSAHHTARFTRLIAPKTLKTSVETKRAEPNRTKTLRKAS